MTNTRKYKKVSDYNVKKEFAKVDQIFQSIENDKSLPAFCNFVMRCLTVGTTENIKLKVTYPKVYKKLILLKEHNAKILAMRK